MTHHADPWLCPGFIGNDWRIARDCIDCARHRMPERSEDDVYWMKPPATLPCPNKIEKGER